jgi:Acetyl/propionyl-CoA carboxylase, alpha subunit
VASGQELPLKQEDLQLRGHSFETRIYAENPYEGFLPGAGNLTHLRPPEHSDTIRIETGKAFFIFFLSPIQGLSTEHRIEPAT